MTFAETVPKRPLKRVQEHSVSHVIDGGHVSMDLSSVLNSEQKH